MLSSLLIATHETYQSKQNGTSLKPWTGIQNWPKPRGQALELIKYNRADEAGGNQGVIPAEEESLSNRFVLECLYKVTQKGRNLDLKRVLPLMKEAADVVDASAKPLDATIPASVTISAKKSISILAIGNSFSVDALEYLHPMLKQAGYSEVILDHVRK